MMNHSDLVTRAERWLRNTRHCSAILTEIHSIAGEQPDAIGWTGAHSILVECKTSRSDFRADADKVWRRLDCLGMGEYRFFCSLPGVIRVSDLPSRWGLLWVEPNRVCVIRESEQFERSWQNEMTLLVSALRRQQKPDKKALAAQDEHDEKHNEEKEKAKMAVANKVSDKLATPGRHFLYLLRVDEDRINSKFSKAEDKKDGVFFWIFQSKKKDEFGIAELVRKMTASDLSPNNNQMKFIKQLSPGITYEDYSGDTKELENKWYEAEIVHESKGDKTYAEIAFIKPYVKPASAAPAAAATPSAAPTPAPVPKETADPLPMRAPDDGPDDPGELPDDPFAGE